MREPVRGIRVCDQIAFVQEWNAVMGHVDRQREIILTPKNLRWWVNLISKWRLWLTS